MKTRGWVNNRVRFLYRCWETFQRRDNNAHLSRGCKGIKNIFATKSGFYQGGQSQQFRLSVRSKTGVWASGPKTLIDLLAMAGGVSEKAGRQVYLYRQGPTGRESSVIDLYALTHDIDGANLSVQAGDIINVPKAGMFFVDGAVRRPGPFSLDRPYTLTQALTSAGGVDTELAKTSNVTIIRRLDSTEGKTVPVNLDDIQAGKTADPQIMAEDVIVVPTVQRNT
jgi:protein involved in polysaccharide export with SLBB domain